jgi:hypothetical protein
VCHDAPSSVDEALAQLHRALAYLHDTDAADLPTQAQAQVLRDLEQAESAHTAVRAKFLAVFTTQGGYEADGQGSARTWLKWQTRVTTNAAAGAIGWAKRLATHPTIGQALASGDLSNSWAKHLCAWTDRLPPQARPDADQILVNAAAAGMGLPELAGLAEEIYQRTHPGPSGDHDGFEERQVRLGVTYGGAGRLEGDLTPGCAHAVSVVLDALGKKAGPEDTRTARQRRHDALEEACRRLITAGMVPGRNGQPSQLMVHMTLSQLRGLAGASEAERAWVAACAASRPGWLTGPEADAAACDATLTPVVTGHLDPAALDRLTDAFLAGSAPATGSQPHRPPGLAPGQHASSNSPPPAAGHRGSAAPPADTGRLRRALLGLAIQAVSGPGGLAAHLRTTFTGGPPPPAGSAGGPPATVSLPLDVGEAAVTIPAHLRKAAGVRHPHCAFPGCDQPLSACDLHHLIPRAQGGPTSLPNLAPLCRFHHLIAVHRWGWTLHLNPDGSTTATSPGRTRTFHSHSRAA